MGTILPTGSPRCICSVCGHGFSNPGTFDRHWQGDKVKGRRSRVLDRCRDPAECGLVLNGDGFWTNPPPKDPYWDKHKQQVVTEPLTQPTLI